MLWLLLLSAGRPGRKRRARAAFDPPIRRLTAKPAVTPPGDYRLNSATVLAFRLYQRLALNLAYTFSYESVVVQDRSHANGTLSVGFAYSTGK